MNSCKPPPPRVIHVLKRGQSDSRDHLANAVRARALSAPQAGKIACHRLFEANLFLQSIQ